MAYEETLNSLRRELAQVRRQSLEATRRGDTLAVAKLTVRASTLNKEIFEIEGKQIDSRPKAGRRKIK